MRAMRAERFSGYQDLKLVEIPKPAVSDGRVLVRLTAAGVTPLLLVVARDDKLTVADLALAAYERALEPKRLALIPGGHFDPYLDQFPLAAAAATEWFREHLLNPGVNHS